MCDDIEKLITLIKSRPAIYNFKLTEHNNKQLVHQNWVEIAMEMQSTVEECKTKYTGLRNSYARFLREKPRHKKWHLANAMSFLKDHMMLNRRVRSSTDTDMDKADQSTTSVPNQKNEFIDCGESEAYTQSSIESDSRKFTRTEHTEQPSSFEYSNNNKEFQSSFEQSKPMISGNDDDDPNFIFFKSLLPDINKLNPRNQRRVKQDFLINLNRLLDNQEMESMRIFTRHEM